MLELELAAGGRRGVLFTDAGEAERVDGLIMDGMAELSGAERAGWLAAGAHGRALRPPTPSSCHAHDARPRARVAVAMESDAVGHTAYTSTYYLVSSPHPTVSHFI